MKRFTALAILTVAGKTVAITGCSVARVADDNEVTFTLADGTSVKKVPEGLAVTRGGTTETIACASFSAESTGSSTAGSVHEQGELELSCGDFELDLQFDCY